VFGSDFLTAFQVGSIKFLHAPVSLFLNSMEWFTVRWMYPSFSNDEYAFQQSECRWYRVRRISEWLESVWLHFYYSQPKKNIALSLARFLQISTHLQLFFHNDISFSQTYFHLSPQSYQVYLFSHCPVVIYLNTHLSGKISPVHNGMFTSQF
jgi:hypothetical protein